MTTKSDTPTQRRFTIQHDPDGDFLSGIAPSGEQVLMGLGDHDLVLVSFTSDGAFLGGYRKQVDFVISDHLSAGERRYEETIQLVAAMKNWWSELGLSAADIRVQQFFMHELDIGTAERPDSYVRAEQQLSSLSDEARGEFERELKDWRSAKKYVLWWGKEYWMSEDGEVIAT